jgi:hypothetical protein
MPEDPLSDHDVEDVLAGRQPANRPEYAAVAEWIVRLREASRAQPSPPITARLRAQIDGRPMPASSTLEIPAATDDGGDEVDAEVTAITAVAGATASGVTERDPRSWRTVVSLAAAVIMVLGVVAGVRLVGGQADEPDVRSRPATEQPIERGVPADDPDDADDADEGGPKESPPPAEADPPSPDAAEDHGSPSPAGEPGRSAPGGWGDLGLEWSEWRDKYCESLMPPRGGGGPMRGGAPPGSYDVGDTICGAGFSETSPHPRKR